MSQQSSDEGSGERAGSLSGLKDLYQEMILDHNRCPRNFHKIEDADRKAEGFNPLCGDHLTLYVKLDGGVIRDIAFEGNGCAISKASSSLMTSSVKGKKLEEVRHLFKEFHQMVTGRPGDPVPEDLGKLAVFSGVCEFPARVKCASLAWHTLKSALEGSGQKVSTEEENSEK